MTWSARLVAGAILGILVVVGVASAFAGLRGRERDEALVNRELNPASVSATDVARAVSSVKEPPRGTGRRTRATGATCNAGAAGSLRNPWRCVVRYASGRSGRYTVTINRRGAWVAVGTAPLNGCCIAVPRFN